MKHTIHAFMITLALAAALTACAGQPAEPIPQEAPPQNAETGGSLYKSMAPDVKEIANGNDYMILSGDSKDAYSYLISDATAETFEVCASALENGAFFPEYKTDSTVIAYTEDHEIIAYLYFYQAPDPADSYLVLTVKHVVEEEPVPEED